jgi:hypothetical protein
LFNLFLSTLLMTFHFFHGLSFVDLLLCFYLIFWPSRLPAILFSGLLEVLKQSTRSRLTLRALRKVVGRLFCQTIFLSSFFIVGPKCSNPNTFSSSAAFALQSKNKNIWLKNCFFQGLTMKAFISVATLKTDIPTKRYFGGI